VGIRTERTLSPRAEDPLSDISPACAIAVASTADDAVYVRVVRFGLTTTRTSFFLAEFEFSWKFRV
jgi:hypothetical protein